MKFFIDTANLDQIRQAASYGILDGVTTNPSLIAKEGRSQYDQIRAICEIVDGDISAEVVSVESDEMIREGRDLAAIHPNLSSNAHSSGKGSRRRRPSPPKVSGST